MKLTIEMKRFAATRWKDGATIQTICDDIQDNFGIEIGRTRLHEVMVQYRHKFPKRTRAEINAAIKAGMARFKTSGRAKASHLKKNFNEEKEIYDGW